MSPSSLDSRIYFESHFIAQIICIFFLMAAKEREILLSRLAGCVRIILESIRPYADYDIIDNVGGFI
jgi:hypothetical protein